MDENNEPLANCSAKISLPLNRLLEDTNRIKIFYRNVTHSVFKGKKVCNFGHKLS